MPVSSIYSPEYNLFQYLKTLIPTISFVVNGYSPESPDNCTKINITSGEPQHWYERNDWSIQVLTRDKSIVYGKVLFDDWPEYVIKWLKYRPRGLVIMLDHIWNRDFHHPQVVKYDGTNFREVEERLEEVVEKTIKDMNS